MAGNRASHFFGLSLDQDFSEPENFMKRIPSKANFTILYHVPFLIKLKFAIGFSA